MTNIKSETLQRNKLGSRFFRPYHLSKLCGDSLKSCHCCRSVRLSATMTARKPQEPQPGGRRTWGRRATLSSCVTSLLHSMTKTKYGNWGVNYILYCTVKHTITIESHVPFYYPKSIFSCLFIQLDTYGSVVIVEKQTDVGQMRISYLFTNTRLWRSKKEDLVCLLLLLWAILLACAVLPDSFTICHHNNVI